MCGSKIDRWYFQCVHAHLILCISLHHILAVLASKQIWSVMATCLLLPHHKHQRNAYISNKNYLHNTSHDVVENPKNSEIHRIFSLLKWFTDFFTYFNIFCGYSTLLWCLVVPCDRQAPPRGSFLEDVSVHGQCPSQKTKLKHSHLLNHCNH